METIRPCKEIPEGRANLPITGPEDMKEPHQDETPVWFTSWLYVQIKVLQADEVITKCRLAEIKACGKTATVEAQLEASSEGASLAGHRLHQLALRGWRTDPS